MGLSVRKIAKLDKPGRYGDGNGLYLFIRPSGSKSWVLRVAQRGRRHDIGLGSATLVNLQEARDQAYMLKKRLREGENIISERLRDNTMPSFREAAIKVWEIQKPSWKNEKYAKQWLTSLETYIYPKIGNDKICDITPAHLLTCLEPIWLTKQETARKLKQKLNTIFLWAQASSFYEKENPVTGLKLVLPRQTRQIEHHPALPWKELPAFVKKLQQCPGVTPQALLFLILTATRSNETRFAEWNEIEGDVWTIPSNRMKMKRDHRVPLTNPMQDILIKQPQDNALLFPHEKRGKVLSENAFRALLQRMGYGHITAHGFRSSFRDWASENNMATREVAEAALAHQLGDQTERAYARSDLFERRRELMQAWGHYVMGE